MKATVLLQNDPLWARIKDFSLDNPNVDFPFSKKLAKEENWTENFTKKAIEEYKKFVYLCCILPKGASPSEIVDKVWHMHLIYTQNYWEEFCPNILQQKLHHHPSKGGLNEKEKHENWFLETLKNYEEIFQEKVPGEIWLNLEKNNRYEKTGKNWLKILSFISVVFILSSCSDMMGNLLSIIFILIPIIFLFVSFISWIINKNEEYKSPNKKDKEGGFGSCGGSSSCSGSSGSSCGGGCGGCGGCGGS